MRFLLSYLLPTVLFGYAHGAALVEPTVIRATSSSSRSTPLTWNFTMSVEANYVDNGDIAFWTRSYCYLGECHFPGPTIEVVPGDNLTLTLVNNLGPNPVGEDTTMNSMHSPNSTNLHTHGMHIDPEVDTVFIHAAPGESLTYYYKVPHDHAPGLYWHHDHVHGGSALRVMGGLAGAIIVRPSGNENLPTSISDADEYVLVLHKMNVGQAKDTDGYVSQACSNSATCDPDTQPPGCTEANYAQSTTFSPFRQYSYHELSAATGSDMNATVVLGEYGTQRTSGSWTYWDYEMQTTFTNGQLEPTITTTKNEVVTLRVVHAAGGEELKLSLTGNGCILQLIAWDGVYVENVRNYTTSDTIYLMAGSRVDLQMQCTGNAGGSIKASSQYSSQNIITLALSGTAQVHQFTTTTELAAIERPFYLSDLTEAVVDIHYSNHVSQGSRPTSVCGGSDLFWWGAGYNCSTVAPWGPDQPSQTFDLCPFGFFEGERGTDPTTYDAAGKLVTYLGNGKTDGEVNEWSLYGLGNSVHPLHLHVFHMQIVSYECVEGSANCNKALMDDWLRVGDWRDVFPTFEGVVRTRFRAVDFAGETVLHCHFLRHEDLGMMDTVLVVDGYRPGYVPTPSPSVNNRPTSEPTHHPSSLPVLPPTPLPTQVPVFPPTPLPTMQPTFKPTPQPSLPPTPTPTTTFSPTTNTPRPTSQPSLEPSSLPTIQPSFAPTTQDTVTLSVGLSFTVTASSAPTTQEKATLLSKIANQTEVEESSISNFDVVYTAARRHLLAGTWDVSFDISVSLATTSFTTASQFQTSVEQSLEESGFETSVTSAIPSISSIDSVTSTSASRNPSPAPTTAPKKNKSDPNKGALTMIIIGAAAVVVLIAIGCYIYSATKKNGVDNDDDRDDASGSGQGSNKPTSRVSARAQKKSNGGQVEML